MSAGTKPWQQPGYTFSIGWPAGYEPVLAEQSVNDKRAQGRAKQAAGQTARRIKAADNGVAYGVGTIPGLSRKSLACDPAKAGLIKKASGL